MAAICDALRAMIIYTFYSSRSQSAAATMACIKAPGIKPPRTEVDGDASLWPPTSVHDVTFTQMSRGHLQSSFHVHSLGGLDDRQIPTVVFAKPVLLDYRGAISWKAEPTNYAVIYFVDLPCDSAVR